MLRLDLLAERVEYGQDRLARIGAARACCRVEPFAVEPVGSPDVGGMLGNDP
jgi:hypothetical protein